MLFYVKLRSLVKKKGRKLEIGVSERIPVKTFGLGYNLDVSETEDWFIDNSISIWIVQRVFLIKVHGVSLFEL